ncbi:MAG: peptidase M24 [Shinella sp.]|nr:MAG: peptidase M24 [Shinella sp.]
MLRIPVCRSGSNVTRKHALLRSLGNEKPLLADGRRAPDRREISYRWLVCTFLVGVTSCTLMGYALYAAVEGRRQLAIPGEALAAANLKPVHEVSRRGTRVVDARNATRATDKTVMKVPIMVRERGVDIVRPESFSVVRMTLAANYKLSTDYPAFDPLEIFAGAKETGLPTARVTDIYASDVMSEISLRSVPFPLRNNSLPFSDAMSVDEIEQDIRSNGSLLLAEKASVTGTYYVDPQRFAADVDENAEVVGSVAARIIEENVSVALREEYNPALPEFVDDIVPSRSTQTISTALIAAGYDSESAANVEEALTARLRSNEINGSDILRIGMLQAGDVGRIVRISLYRNGRHALTLAVNDQQRLVAGAEPPPLDAIATTFEEGTPAVSSMRDPPTVYAGIYRAGLSYGMTKEMITRVMRLVAGRIDLQASTRSTDRLEAFFSAADENGKATGESELLYVRGRFGETVMSFYRFQDPETESVDYYDETGNAIRPLLLRTPLPTGRLTSGFGGRIDPFLGYARGHTGIDWAASRGTPIMAAGDGVVEKAGWSSSYGNHTVIRHSNGYVTSYSHQNAIAKGVQAGARVSQGQIIGFVGSTGRSTGSHLHYELTVNGTRVDAMKTRFPQAGNLTGKSLQQFEIVRDRIDSLLNNMRG